MTSQSVFSSGLLTAGSPCPPGLTAWNGSDPGRRFDVYRNNVLVSLVDAMADSYPVVEALVGTEFFRAMAGVFVSANPPRSPVMAHYGARFDTFISSFPPAATLPYLADVARLEQLRVQAFHAADAIALDSSDLAALTANSDALPGARVLLHPSVAVMSSPFAVASLWLAHQAADVSAAVSQVDTRQPESVLLTRINFEVIMYSIDNATMDFVAALTAGETLAVAATTAQATDQNFDLPAALTLLLSSESLLSLQLPEETSHA